MQGAQSQIREFLKNRVGYKPGVCRCFGGDGEYLWWWLLYFCDGNMVIVMVL
jgi:hypothetical protein